jgi:hypothetical protein
MSQYYRRKKTGARENMGAGLAALGIAAGAAAVTFYLVRLFLSREPLGPFDPPRLPSSSPPALGEGRDPSPKEPDERG